MGFRPGIEAMDGARTNNVQESPVKLAKMYYWPAMYQKISQW